MPGIKDWLLKARSDLKASKKLMDDNETLDCTVFHTHQCAEKSFKAFIVSLQKLVPKTHDLNALFALCIEKNKDLIFLIDESKNLDDYGYNSRYPNDNFYIDQSLTGKAIGDAEKIFSVIQNKILKKN